MTQDTTARLLDLSRLLSRVGHGPFTGVDRVEYAYLGHLLSLDAPLFGLVGTSLGQVLLDRAGIGALADRLAGKTAWGQADLISRLSRGKTELRRRAESDLRRLALAIALPNRTGQMLRRHLPEGAAYVNVGHSNLGHATLAGARAIRGGKVAVLIHDMIPLAHPEYTRAGQSAVFEAKMRRVGSAADLVIYNSAQSRRDGERHFATWGRVPPGLVAHLGVDLRLSDAGSVPKQVDRGRPYFVCLGTIEPRKNHALLLDLWQEFAATLPAAQIPGLVIVGQRGWNNAAVFTRLDALDKAGPVCELSGLSDAAVTALLQASAGLLFPSFAEGFGLPAAEAAALGIPVLCNDLSVLREYLGEYPVYAPVTDRYLWARTIRMLAEQAGAGQKAGGQGVLPVLPTWQDHFNLVLKMT